MTIRQKLYAAGVVALLIFTFAAVHSIRLRFAMKRSDREAAVQAAKVSESERLAASAEESSNRSAARAEYLEQQLKEIRDLAAKQDEQIKKLGADSGSARGRVDRARRIRTIESTAAAVCEKLKDLGHGCDE